MPERRGIRADLFRESVLKRFHGPLAPDTPRWLAPAVRWLLVPAVALLLAALALASQLRERKGALEDGVGSRRTTARVVAAALDDVACVG